MKKRFISMALALCMVLTLLPMTVAAAASGGVEEVILKGNHFGAEKLGTTQLTGTDWTSVDFSEQAIRTWPQIEINKDDATSSVKSSDVIPMEGYNTRGWIVSRENIQYLKDDHTAADGSLDRKSIQDYARAFDSKDAIVDGDLLLIAAQNNAGVNNYTFHVAVVKVVTRTETSGLAGVANKGTKYETPLGPSVSVAEEDDEDTTWAGSDMFDLHTLGYQTIYTAEGADSVTVNFTPANNYSKIVGIRIVKTLGNTRGEPARGAFKASKLPV